MPGRTDNEIKNVWNTHLKKRLLPTNKVSDSSGDEPKESPTTSSSSSSSLLSSDQNQTLETEPPNKANSINNNLFCPKQQTTSSLSTNTSNSNSNSSSQVDTFWPQNHFDFGEEVNNKKENEEMRSELELELESPSNNMGIEIPLESDVEFWDMLDLDNIDLFESNEVEQNYCQGSNFGIEKNQEFENQEFENDKWFKYLENELGLDRPPEANDDTGADETMAAERLSVDVDPCMTYFADGFTRQL